MPVRSRGSLLAGIILLGLLGLAGAGCHTSTRYPIEGSVSGSDRSAVGGPNDAYAIRPAGSSVTRVSLLDRRRTVSPESAPPAGTPPAPAAGANGSPLFTFHHSQPASDPDATPMPGTVIATSGPAASAHVPPVAKKAPAPATGPTTSRATPKKTTTTCLWQPWKRPTTPAKPIMPPGVPVSGSVIAVSGQASEAGTGVTPAIVPLELTAPLPGLTVNVSASNVPARLGQGPDIAAPPPANPAIIATSPTDPRDRDVPGSGAAPASEDRTGSRPEREPKKDMEEAPTPRTIATSPPPAAVPVAGMPVAGAPGMVPHGYGPPPVPRELAKRALSPYIIEPPDVLLIESSQKLLPDQPLLRNQHIVSMDGYVRMGIYGQVFVAGMTIDQARAAVAQQLSRRVKDVKVEDIVVDVLAYNSKFYYVITDGGGWGQQVYRLPYTGNETVLDAVSQIGGLPPVASKKKIWLARATPNCHQPHILPVDWCCIAQRGAADTNYQLFPGDRLFVQSDARIRADGWLIKTLSPVQRILGTTLLGASTVNAIEGRSSFGGSGVR